MNPLTRLREIRVQLDACAELLPEREGLLRESRGRYSERRLAEAAGLSRWRVRQILATGERRKRI